LQRGFREVRDHRFEELAVEPTFFVFQPFGESASQYYRLQAARDLRRALQVTGRRDAMGMINQEIETSATYSYR
jgi:hypothetical protein